MEWADIQNIYCFSDRIILSIWVPNHMRSPPKGSEISVSLNPLLLYFASFLIYFSNYKCTPDSTLNCFQAQQQRNPIFFQKAIYAVQTQPHLNHNSQRNSSNEFGRSPQPLLTCQQLRCLASLCQGKSATFGSIWKVSIQQLRCCINIHWTVHLRIYTIR